MYNLFDPTDEFAYMPDESAYTSANIALLHAKSSYPLHTSPLGSAGVSEPMGDLSD